MLKTIQQKLREASILDDKEPILSFIQVLDLAKLPQNQFKKFTQEELANLLSSGKVYYLLASSELKNVQNYFKKCSSFDFYILNQSQSDRKRLTTDDLFDKSERENARFQTKTHMEFERDKNNHKTRLQTK